MLSKVKELSYIFEELLHNNLALSGIIRGSVGSIKRFPTENDIDILILTPYKNTHPSIKSILTERIEGFKRLNWGDNESFIVNANEQYDLDIDLISIKWLPLDPIMAKAHIDIIDDSTIVFGQEAIKNYRDTLKEISLSK